MSRILKRTENSRFGNQLKPRFVKMPSADATKTNNLNPDAIPIPNGITRNDIFVDVSIAGVLKAKAEIFFCDELINGTQHAVEKTLRQMYTGTPMSKFNLRISINMISDGSFSGKLAVTDSSIGEVVVGIAWTLSGPDKMTAQRKAYKGGVVVFRQQLDLLEFLDPNGSVGERLALDQLAPKCAYNVASEIGIASTKFFRAPDE